MNGLFARARSFWRGLWRRDRLWAEMDEEMRFHVEMVAERLQREQGLEPVEARRQAAVAFGGVEKFKEAGHDARGVAWVSGLSLDLKLAWRMLVKSPGLTVVGVLGIALGVAVAVGFFAVISTFLYPDVPLDEGDRIVALENWDIDANNESRRSLHDYLTWREEMRSVEQVSATTIRFSGLATGDGPAQPVRHAQMTASGFNIARVPPLLGRYLHPEDEHPGAPHVVVIGHDLWRERFDGDPRAVGKTVLVSDTPHIVVGVMPAGFEFPMNQQIWTPLRVDASQIERGGGPVLFVFGRLVPGATREHAQAELAMLGRRAAAAYPKTHARLRPAVLPYTYPLDDIQDVRLWETAQVQMMVNLLLIAIAVNVGVLVYARTAMRQGEIAVRSALGASRRRIVGQLFVEALLLTAVGAAVGLALAHLVLQRVSGIVDGQIGIGFWIDFGLRPRTALYAAALALLAALIVGVVPAWKSTGRRLEADLRRIGNGTTLRLGRAWTMLIVAQVAAAVALLPSAMSVGVNQIRWAATSPAYAAEEFLSVELSLATPVRPGMDGAAYRRETAARFADRLPELERRLEAEPAVVGVTITGRRPDRSGLVQAEGVGNPVSTPGHYVPVRGVGLDYFELFGARVLAGRAFHAGDLGDSSRAVIVNHSFAEGLLAGGPALGRRVRLVEEPEQRQELQSVEPGPWLEIVGVVADLERSAMDREVRRAELYYPVGPGQLQSAGVLVHVRGGDTDQFAPRFRAIAADVDPDLRLGAVANLAARPNAPMIAAAVAALALGLATVTLLSAAGIHALMSLTVTRRRREIGIRSALGAGRGRLLASIFSRAAGQLALGALVGALVGARLLFSTGTQGPRSALFLGGVVALMLFTGLAAATGPARRGLRIPPMEALREE